MRSSLLWFDQIKDRDGNPLWSVSICLLSELVVKNDIYFEIL